jgi:acetyl esterase
MSERERMITEDKLFNPRKAMAIDQATSALLAQMAQSGLPPLHEMGVEQARGLAKRMRERNGPGPDVLRSEQATVRVVDGSFPLRVLVPKERPRGIIVYYHGGGWVVGEIGDFEAFGKTLAQCTGCAVVLVGYRLAPEHRYPTAAEDAWAALLWASSQTQDIAGDAVPLIVAGDSAGGNLAAIAAQRARDNETWGPNVCLQILAYPVTDCNLNTPSYLDPANQLLLRRESMIWFWDHYVPDTKLRHRPDASPLRGKLTGLPPAVILTAEYDPLRDEGDAYAAALRAAGVAVEHRRFSGQMHGFLTMIDVLPASAEGIDYVAGALDKRLKTQRV